MPEAELGSLTIESHANTSEPLLCRTDLPTVLRHSASEAAKALVLLLDSQVGTGAAAIMALRVLLDHGVKEENIVLVCFVCSRRGGCQALSQAFPCVCPSLAGSSVTERAQPRPHRHERRRRRRRASPHRRAHLGSSWTDRKRRPTAVDFFPTLRLIRLVSSTHTRTTCTFTLHSRITLMPRPSSLRQVRLSYALPTTPRPPRLCTPSASVSSSEVEVQSDAPALFVPSCC